MRYTAAQSISQAAVDVCAMLGGDFRIICLPLVGGEHSAIVFLACCRRHQARE